ncbi:hypothetical protein NM688_g9015 [Phlebia brevispora]|uniref:Uncharacterized protein n=1 Tax=Phlebia brevispora TaxID=194682 RepID=A0ACC1RPR4_9APHY|nr:hypothetical protein NM688_g9015 [Phlebia brevispora]
MACAKALQMADIVYEVFRLGSPKKTDLAAYTLVCRTWRPDAQRQHRRSLSFHCAKAAFSAVLSHLEDGRRWLWDVKELHLYGVSEPDDPALLSICELDQMLGMLPRLEILHLAKLVLTACPLKSLEMFPDEGHLCAPQSGSVATLILDDVPHNGGLHFVTHSRAQALPAIPQLPALDPIVLLRRGQKNGDGQWGTFDRLVLVGVYWQWEVCAGTITVRSLVLDAGMVRGMPLLPFAGVEDLEVLNMNHLSMRSMFYLMKDVRPSLRRLHLGFNGLLYDRPYLPERWMLWWKRLSRCSLAYLRLTILVSNYGSDSHRAIEGLVDHLPNSLEHLAIHFDVHRCTSKDLRAVVVPFPFAAISRHVRAMEHRPVVEFKLGHSTVTTNTFQEVCLQGDPTAIPTLGDIERHQTYTPWFPKWYYMIILHVLCQRPFSGEHVLLSKVIHSTIAWCPVVGKSALVKAGSATGLSPTSSMNSKSLSMGTTWRTVFTSSVKFFQVIQYEDVYCDAVTHPPDSE